MKNKTKVNKMDLIDLLGNPKGKKKSTLRMGKKCNKQRPTWASSPKHVNCSCSSRSYGTAKQEKFFCPKV